MARGGLLEDPCSGRCRRSGGSGRSGRRLPRCRRRLAGIAVHAQPPPMKCTISSRSPGGQRHAVVGRNAARSPGCAPPRPWARRGRAGRSRSATVAPSGTSRASPFTSMASAPWSCWRGMWRSRGGAASRRGAWPCPRRPPLAPWKRARASPPALTRERPLTPPLIAVLNGPNLNMLGTRQPEIYGRDTLDDVEALCAETAEALGLAIDFRQTNGGGRAGHLGAGMPRPRGGHHHQPGGLQPHLHRPDGRAEGGGAAGVEVHITQHPPPGGIPAPQLRVQGRDRRDRGAWHPGLCAGAARHGRSCWTSKERPDGAA